MALRIEDPGSLPGRKVVDQEGADVGEIKEVYGLGDDGDPMWVAIETATGGIAGEDKMAVVPLARLRERDGDLSVPYTLNHVQDAPEVELGDEISEEDERELRIYYAIDLADQEFRSEPRSYASQVPEGDGPSRKVTDELESKQSESGESEGSGSDASHDKEESDEEESDEDESEREKSDEKESDEDEESDDG